MIPLDLIVKTPEILENNLKNRGKLREDGYFMCVLKPQVAERLVAKNIVRLIAGSCFINIAGILCLQEERKKITIESETLQNTRNKLAKEVGILKSKGQDASNVLKESELIKNTVGELEEKRYYIDEEIEQILLSLPNIPASDVPVGKDENDNQEIKRFLSPRVFDFTPKPHDDLGVDLGLMDFETAANISGSRFVLLKGGLARLERVLAGFMLENAINRGFMEVNVPLLVRPKAFYGTGQLPKFEGNFYEVDGGYYLIPTAEVSLTNMVADKILTENQLPMRLTAYTPCFRNEAGAAGKDTKGMIRHHQFTKVELVTVCKPSQSTEEHEYMLETSEKVLQDLDLPYRIVKLCTGDMGAASTKTYDIEVWLPSQNTYREISSVSNMGDFQARRMMARFKSSGKNEYLHTLNGSALAVGRTLVAILENYQNTDGTITLPEVLRKSMGISQIG